MPIKSGRDTVAVLELLSTATTPPASELTLFLDAIAIQLGMLVQQEKAAHAHHWYIGRL